MTNKKKTTCWNKMCCDWNADESSNCIYRNPHDLCDESISRDDSRKLANKIKNLVAACPHCGGDV